MFRKITKSIQFIGRFAWIDNRASKKIAIATTVTVTASLALNVASPTMIHSVMSNLPLIGESALAEGVISLAGSLGIFWGVKNITRLIRTAALFLQSNEIAKNMATAIAEKIFKQKMIAPKDIPADAIANSVERAYDCVDTIVQKGTINFIQNMLEITAIAGYLSYRYSPVFLLGIATTTSGYIIYTMAYIPNMVKKRNQYIAIYRKSREKTFDILQNNGGVRYFGRMQDSTNEIHRALTLRNSEYEQYAKTSFKIQAAQTTIVGIGMTSLICYMLLIIQPHEYKQLAKIIGYILQWGDLFENLGTTLAQFDGAVRGIDDLMEIFEKLPVVEEKYDAKKLSIDFATRVSLSFSNVSLACKDQKLLSDINFSLHPGTVTALIGPSGAGKSTIAKLILRLDDPTSGNISILHDQVSTNIKDFHLESWRQTVAYLSQGKDTIIFKRSLKENLEIAKKFVSTEEMMDAISLSGLDRVVKKLPQGIDNIIGEGSTSNLSGGERKLLALARFLLCDKSPICILDEPSSDLDPETSSNVLSTIETFTKNKTTMIITHDLQYAARIADQIIIVDNGKIQEIRNNSAIKFDETLETQHTQMTIKKAQ